MPCFLIKAFEESLKMIGYLIGYNSFSPSLSHPSSPLSRLPSSPSLSPLPLSPLPSPSSSFPLTSPFVFSKDP